MATALFDRERIRQTISPQPVIEAVEAAFAAVANGRTEMPAKTYLDLARYNGDFRAMPAYVETNEWDAAGIKWVNVHPDNPERYGLPTVLGMMIYSDPATARPLAVMDGTELTRQRTAAAAAVATKHLAKTDATSLGIVGAGAQSYTQVEYISTVRDIRDIVVSDIEDEAIDQFREYIADRFSVTRGSPSDAASCDIVSTLTPVREPIIPADAVGEETHINAIGADAPGKQELDPAILESGTVVIDDLEQCIHSGEVNVPLQEGRLEESDIYAPLGSIVANDVPGRQPGEGVTIFDSTGLAIQDVAAAHVVYETAAPNERFDFQRLE